MAIFESKITDKYYPQINEHPQYNIYSRKIDKKQVQQNLGQNLWKKLLYVFQFRETFYRLQCYCTYLSLEILTITYNAIVKAKNFKTSNAPHPE